MRMVGVCIASMVVFGSVGAFKGISVLDEAVPGDLTILALLVVIGLCFAVRRSVDFNSIGWVVMVWIFFLPGLAVNLARQDLSLYKSVYLFSITFVASASAALVVSTRLFRAWWTYGVIALGVVMGIALVVFPDEGFLRQFGRFRLEGGSAISAARVLSAAALASIMVVAAGLVSRGRILLLALGGLLLALAFASGSRGPVVAFIICLPIGLFLTGSSGLQRSGRAVLGVVLVLFSLTVASLSNMAGVSRILSFVSERDDAGRGALLEAAETMAADSVLGYGWGGFDYSLSGPGAGSDAMTHPHNLLWELLVENGWVGAAAVFFAIVYLLLRSGYLISDPSVSVIMTLAIYWLLNSLASSDINGNREMWQTLAILSAAVLVSRRSSESTAPPK